MSLETLTEKVRKKVGANSGFGHTIKFDFGDEGVIFVDATKVPNEVSNEDKEAEATVKTSLANFEKIANGETDPTVLYMTGRLKVNGSMGVALKLSSLL